MMQTQVFGHWSRKCVKAIVGMAVTVLLSFQSVAESISHQQWLVLQKGNSEVTDILNRDGEELRALFHENKLDTLLQHKKPSEQTYLKGQLLKKLGKELNPLLGERAEDHHIITWVKSQSFSQEFIQIPNVDHPHHQLQTLNIKNIANATYRWWEVKQHLSTFKSEGIYSPNLKSWLVSKEEVPKQALELWIKSLNQQQAEVIANTWLSVERASSDVASNTTPVMLAIARQSKNPEIYRRVWSNPVNEFSYQLLQSVPQFLSAEAGIEQLLIAAQKDKLQSQAMFLMARHYWSDNTVQTFLKESLAQKDRFWSALMALKQNADSDFWQGLKTDNSSVLSDLQVSQKQALNRIIQTQGEAL